ncbi:30S ribosomal protein S9 [Candidatus Woesearchaeota archaeon]|nr:30S ribosomal protein S9 [Candidatus Woesearchaeota archaeon]
MVKKKTEKKEESKQTNVVHVSGTRKRSIARATLKEGRGRIKINNYLLDNYEPEFARAKIMEPLMIAGDLSNKVDIKINVHGGGWRSQSDAVRLAISRALVKYSKDKALEKSFLDYDRHLLVADIRRKEQRKPNDSKARAMRTKSYR